MAVCVSVSMCGSCCMVVFVGVRVVVGVGEDECHLVYVWLVLCSTGCVVVVPFSSS